jgi:gliding motility-associated-like protein
VANAFSPNGDGVNDELKVYYQGSEVIGVESFKIYDRNGNIIHSIHPIKFRGQTDLWDGSSNEGKLLPGVYIYSMRMDLNGEMIDLKGDVTIVK